MVLRTDVVSRITQANDIVYAGGNCIIGVKNPGERSRSVSIYDSLGNSIYNAKEHGGFSIRFGGDLYSKEIGGLNIIRSEGGTLVCASTEVDGKLQFLIQGRFMGTSAIRNVIGNNEYITVVKEGDLNTGTEIRVIENGSTIGTRTLDGCFVVENIYKNKRGNVVAVMSGKREAVKHHPTPETAERLLMNLRQWYIDHVFGKDNRYTWVGGGQLAVPILETNGDKCCLINDEHEALYNVKEIRGLEEDKDLERSVPKMVFSEWEKVRRIQ
jgi:hypothetical protein